MIYHIFEKIEKTILTRKKKGKRIGQSTEGKDGVNLNLWVT